MIVVMYPDCVENTFDDAISYEVTNRNVSYKCYNYGSYDAVNFLFIISLTFGISKNFEKKFQKNGGYQKLNWPIKVINN